MHFEFLDNILTFSLLKFASTTIQAIRFHSTREAKCGKSQRPSWPRPSRVGTFRVSGSTEYLNVRYEDGYHLTPTEVIRALTSPTFTFPLAIPSSEIS